MIKKAALVVAILSTVGVVGQVSAKTRDFLVRFDGGVGVDPVGGVVGPTNAGDGSFQNVAQNIVRGVKPAGSPWRIADLRADVDADGGITVRGKGLRLAGGDKIGQSLQLSVAATLICEATIPFVEHTTSGVVQLDLNGDFRIDDTLFPVPSECPSPVLLIRAGANGPWLAAALPRFGDE